MVISLMVGCRRTWAKTGIVRMEIGSVQLVMLMINYASVERLGWRRRRSWICDTERNTANLCKIVDKAQISIDGHGNRPVARMRSPSSTERGPHSEWGSLISMSSAVSWSISGREPTEQISIFLASVFRAILSLQSSSLHPEQQCRGHLDILTSPMAQSISGLCLQSQECPSIIFCLPRLVTAKVVRSECFLWRSMRLTTSVIEPASLGDRSPHCTLESVGLTLLG